MRSVRIGVIGDFFLDKYLDTEPGLAETSVETGLVAHQVTREVVSAGAAGTVVNNLSALRVASIQAFGAIGEDGNGFELSRCLEQRDCGRDGLVVSKALMTPTYLKPRDATIDGLAGEYSRYDTKNRSQLPQGIEAEILKRFTASLPKMDAVIIVDQIQKDEGAIITPGLRNAIGRLAKSSVNCHFLADSRFHIRDFENVILKPNQYEAVGAHFPPPGEQIEAEQLETALGKLLQTSRKAVICTLGADGVLVRSAAGQNHVPASPISGPVDPTGAGDSFSAGYAASLAAGATLVEAACVGVLCAAVTAQMLAQTGTASAAAVLDEGKKWSRQFA